MSLVLAIKNRHSVVVASDLDPAQDNDGFGQFIRLPGRKVLLVTGNLEAVRHTVTQTLLPKIDAQTSAAAVAQILQAALVLEVVPTLSQMKGRVEFIVAGIDPVRHTEELGLYYLDSAQDFYLKIVEGDAVAAGATAAATSLLQGRSFSDDPVEQLKTLAKDCLASTKLRWPGAVSSHVRLGVIMTQNIQIEDF
jgi:hypothetical protein